MLLTACYYYYYYYYYYYLWYYCSYNILPSISIYHGDVVVTFTSHWKLILFICYYYNNRRFNRLWKKDLTHTWHHRSTRSQVNRPVRDTTVIHWQPYSRMGFTKKDNLSCLSIGCFKTAKIIIFITNKITLLFILFI